MMWMKSEQSYEATSTCSMVLLCFIIVSVDQSTGDNAGTHCVFPFIYNGNLYYECISLGENEGPWCATTSNYDEDGEWGKCISKYISKKSDSWNILDTSNMVQYVLECKRPKAG